MSNLCISKMYEPNYTWIDPPKVKFPPNMAYEPNEATEALYGPNAKAACTCWTDILSQINCRRYQNSDEPCSCGGTLMKMTINTSRERVLGHWFDFVVCMDCKYVTRGYMLISD